MNRTTRFNIKNFWILVSLAILVGTEVIGVALAAGWAIAGLMGFGPTVGYVLMAVFAMLGGYALLHFMRRAAKVEPLRS